MVRLCRLEITRRFVGIVLAASILAGCSGWRAQGQAPDTALGSRESPMHVRVTLRDGQYREIYLASVQGDSLVGVGPIRQSAVGSTERIRPRIAVALDDIQTLEIRSFSGGKTALLVVGIVAAVGVVAAVVYVVYVAAVAVGGAFGEGIAEAFE